MDKQNIIDQIYTLYSNNRKILIEKLNKFNWESSVMVEIHEKIITQIERPILAIGDLDNEIKINNFKDKFGDIKTGDISDKYEIVTNQEINEISDWDFTDFIIKDKEVRYISIWVNWFIPVYYLEYNFDKGKERGRLIEHGRVNKYSQYEKTIVKKIEDIFEQFEYHKCELPFLKQVAKGLQTDVIEENPSLFECLFSDWNYYTEGTKIFNMSKPENNK